MITIESDELLPALRTLAAGYWELRLVYYFGKTVRRDGTRVIKRWRGKEYML